MQWNGTKNGALLELMKHHGFDALLTFDKNLQHQQNFAKYTLAVFVLAAPSNTYLKLSKLTDVIHSYLTGERLPIGPILIVAGGSGG